MTTRPSTAEGVDAVLSGPPDELTLTRLVTEAYGAMPGHEPRPASTPEYPTGERPTQPGPSPVESRPHAVASGHAIPVEVPGIELPDAASGNHRATSATAAPATPAGQPPADSTPELPRELAIEILRPARSDRPGPAFTLPDMSPAREPSFYFIEDRPRSRESEAPVATGAPPHLDVEAVRRDFPILGERVHGRRLVWLDNAATTQKPQAVIDRLVEFYSHENSNIHRSAHFLAARATDAYEGARSTVADFLGAPSATDVVFTRGATEAINLVAETCGRSHVGPGDEIVISHLEHHANIVPWQRLAAETGATMKVIPVDDDGQLLLDAYRDLLSDRTRLVAVAHVSNVTGTIVPVREIVEMAHRVGAKVLIDGAQAVAHLVVDVQAMDPDFYVFSGHKVFGPTGIGALYGRSSCLEKLAPWQVGGNMISDVTFERTRFQHPPTRFEAGTGNIADAVGLAAALDYVNRLRRPAIERYEHELIGYAVDEIRTVPGLRLIGTAAARASVLTFVLEGCRPEDVGSALDREGIAVRAGHHCAQPILRRYGVETAVRASLALYNTHAEVDLLVAALHRLATAAGNRH
jgi:cysteine desulfurase/selenocysteine lyase